MFNKKNVDIKSVLKLLLLVILPASIITVVVFKMASIEIGYGNYTGYATGYFSYSVFKNDSVILAFILFFFVLSCSTKSFILRFTFRLLALFVVGIYTLDVAILKVFYTHLTVDDFFKYLHFSPQFIYLMFKEVFFLGERIISLLMTIILGTSAVYFLVSPLNRNRRLQNGLLLLAAGLLVFYFLPEKRTYIHSWIYTNVFAYNLLKGVDVPYSDDFKNDVLKSREKMSHLICRSEDDPVRKNIVIVVIESLSMYHSQFFSGLSDTTPHLDRIARENISFNNFYANGFTTENALIAILMGIPNIPPVHNYLDEPIFGFAGYFDQEDTLPNRLNKEGYTSEFLTTGNLEFINKGKWLKNIGFDYIEGHDHPFYNQWERHVFDAAPDEALYQRAIDRIFGLQRDQPYLMVLETVSTHHPFINPETKNRSETDVFSYADRQLGIFYDQLKNNGFFENGLLIITSDQHSMKPLTQGEINLYGERAYAKIPMVVCSGTGKEIISHAFQQVDLYTSISNYVSGLQCTSKWNGDFLSSPRQPAECLFYVRGDERDIVSIFCGSMHGKVKLNGNNTGLISGNIPYIDEIVDRINFERISREGRL